MGKSFVDEFEVKEEKYEFNDVPDYEAFTNIWFVGVQLLVC